MRWIWRGVMRAPSSTAALAFVTAMMIFEISKVASAPFLLMIFIFLFLPLVIENTISCAENRFILY